jgi:hypothetical protein
LGHSPRTEFPRDNIARTEVRALLVYRLTCSQVAPCGARPERGGPCIGGIAEVDVRVDVTVLPREVKPLGFGVLEDQAHGLGQLVHDSVSSYKLGEVRFQRGGLRHDGAVVHEGNEKGRCDPLKHTVQIQIGSSIDTNH